MVVHNRFRIIFLLLLGLVFAGCEPELTSDTTVGSLWQVSLDKNGDADWLSASSVAQEQYQGYTLANDHLSEVIFKNTVAGEGIHPDDIQMAIRSMVEQDQVVAVIGATTNQATMRVASLVNFFNVPMIVPSANGDNLLPSNNLWAFRLSAPGSAYANYIFGSALTKINMGSNDDAKSVLKIAILYEQNTFGESAAVATARAAMLQEMEIGVYASFSPENPDPDRMGNLVNQVIENKVHLVYIISSEPAVAKTLVQIFHSRIQNDSMPVLVGQSGGFASTEFIESDSSADVYVIRQQLQAESCPAEIHSHYEAQTYAAVYLLEQAVQQGIENQPESKFSIFPQDKSAELASFRENVRDILKQIDLNIPCLGQVAFDNTGQNKYLQFELVIAQDDQLIIVSTDDFLSTVKRRSALNTIQ